MEGKRIAIIDKDGGKLLDVVESSASPGVFGIVALNPDGSDIEGGGGGGGGQVNSVVAGTDISVDNTDPVNPVVSLSLGADENFVTDAEKTILTNTSGTNTGDQDLSGLAPLAGATFTGEVSVPDEAYGVGWNGSAEVPTKNALYDKIETLGGGGLSWNATVNGATGTGLALALDNSYASSGVGQSITIGNTQTQALTGLSINTGTSAVGQVGMAISCTNASTSSRGIAINPSTTGTGYGIEFTGQGGNNWRGLSFSNWSATSQTRYGMYFGTVTVGTSGASYGIYQSGFSQSSSARGYGIYQGYLNQSSGTGYGLYQAQLTQSNSGNAYGWYVAAMSGAQASTNNSMFFSLNENITGGTLSARTNNLSEMLWQHTYTATSGTKADNFSLLNIRRTSVQNGAGGTTTAAGSVLRLENVATQTAGTLTDSVNPLILVQSANSTGAAAYISTAGTGKTAFKFDSGFTSATASTGALTLPALASGYVTIDIGGTPYKIPYYAN